MLRNDAVRRELRGIAIALMMVAATTLVAFLLIRYLEVRRGSVIYLLPVLLAGWHLGLLPALVAAVAGVLWSGYFFFSPYYSYYLARPPEILNLVLFMVVAVVTSHLANSMKRQTELARKRENEMSYLYAFSRRLSAAPSAEDIYTAIEEHLATLVRRKVILFGAASARDDRDLPDERTVPERVRAEVAQTDSTLGTTIDDGTGNIWLVRRVSEKTADFGVIAIDLGSVPAAAIADVRLRVDDVLSDAAATLERLDVARALNDAKMRSETELLREALIGSVSHELRTPLASILGATTVLTSAPIVTADPKLDALASVVRDETERLNTVSRTCSTRPASAPTRCGRGLNGSRSPTSSMRRCSATARGSPAIEVKLDLAAELPLAYVDQNLVEQALGHVIENAMKYSPTGSPIRIAARSRTA